MSENDQSVAWKLLIHLALLSMTAIGGGVVILAPDVQRFVVDVNHWLDNETFIAAYTIAQAAPGPNLLFVTLVGWYAAGWLGAVSATLAVVVPPAILAIVALRTSRRPRARSLGLALKSAFLPISVGLVLATGWSLARAADQSWMSAALTILATTIFFYHKPNPLWLIAAGAIVGIMNWT